MKLHPCIHELAPLLREQTPRGKILRLGYFILLYYLSGILSPLLQFIGNEIHGPVHHLLATFITTGSVTALKPFYHQISASPDFTIRIGTVTPIKLFPGCNGFAHLVRILITLCIYPIRLKKKLILFPVTCGIILLAATLHFLILIPIAYEIPTWYPLSHHWFTRILFFGLYFLCWLIWEKGGLQRIHRLLPINGKDLQAAGVGIKEMDQLRREGAHEKGEVL